MLKIEEYRTQELRDGEIHAIYQPDKYDESGHGKDIYFTGRPNTGDRGYCQIHFYCSVERSIFRLDYPENVSNYYWGKDLKKAHSKYNEVIGTAQPSHACCVTALAGLSYEVFLANNPFDSSLIDCFELDFPRTCLKRYSSIETPHKKVVKIERLYKYDGIGKSFEVRFLTLGQEGKLFVWEANLSNVSSDLSKERPLRFSPHFLSITPERSWKETIRSQSFPNSMEHNNLPIANFSAVDALPSVHNAGLKRCVQVFSDTFFTTVPINNTEKIYYNTQKWAPFSGDFIRKVLGPCVMEQKTRLSKIVESQMIGLLGIQRGLPELPFDSIGRVNIETFEFKGFFTLSSTYFEKTHGQSECAAAYFDSLVVLDQGILGSFWGVFIAAGRVLFKDGSSSLFIQSWNREGNNLVQKNPLKTCIIEGVSLPINLLRLCGQTFLLSFRDKNNTFHVHWMGRGLNLIDRISWNNPNKIEEDIWFTRVAFEDRSVAVFINPDLIASSSKRGSSPFIFRLDPPVEKNSRSLSVLEEDKKDNFEVNQASSVTIQEHLPRRKMLDSEIQEIRREIAAAGREPIDEEELRASIELMRAIGKYREDIIETSRNNRRSRDLEGAVQALLSHKNKRVSEYYREMDLMLGSVLLAAQVSFSNIFSVRPRVSFNALTTALNGVRLSAKAFTMFGRIFPIVGGMADSIGSAVEEVAEEVADRLKKDHLKKIARFCKHHEIEALSEAVARGLAYANEGLIGTKGEDISKLVEKHVDKLIKAILKREEALGSFPEKVNFLVSNIGLARSNSAIRRGSHLASASLSHAEELQNLKEALETQQKQIQALQRRLSLGRGSDHSTHEIEMGDQLQAQVQDQVSKSVTQNNQASVSSGEDIIGKFERNLASFGIAALQQMEDLNSRLRALEERKS